MTLNLTIVNQNGAWQSADHQLSDLDSGQPLDDDESMKQVILRCRDGSALIAYAGVAAMKIPSINRFPLSDWLREILRGELRTVDESMIFIRDAAGHAGYGRTA